jgi:hypothetical protein
VVCGDDLLDLSLTPDERRIRVHLQKLLGQRTVRTLVRRGAQNDGNVEDFANFRVGQDVLLVEGWVPISSELEETDLQVENQE